ncbi:hypothetical protein LCGC14_0621390 [marine sediment metagenome]|uniref:Uncharacterized protein n=1 Tax=marine sediment metagenome TaxID=412755 RepID=A0A0F9RP31_9ZZZZ
MGSTLMAIIADNQKPSLNLVRKQKAFGWWEQYVAGLALKPQAISANGGQPSAVAQSNGTIRLRVDDVNDVAFGRSMVILEGFKGGKVEISGRIAFVDAIPGVETVTIALVALPAILGQATFPTPVFPGDVIGTAIVFDNTVTDVIQEISAVFEPDAADGDHLAIGIVAVKTAGATPISVDVAGLQTAQILQQSVPRGGNR